MVSETFEPARKERKGKVTSAAELQKKVYKQSEYRLKTQSRSGLHTAYNTD